MGIKEFFNKNFKRKEDDNKKIDKYRAILDDYKKDEFIPGEKFFEEELKEIINKTLKKHGKDKFEIFYTIRKKNSTDIKILSAQDTINLLEKNISEIDEYIWTILLKKKY